MKILAIQNRMGIGDTIIFLPFIEAISKKYNSPIDLLVRQNSKAEQYLDGSNYIKNIFTLDRNSSYNGKHDGFFGAWNLILNFREKKFDKIFIFNSSLRYNIIAKLAGIKEIYQYPLLKKNKQHITETAKKFIEDSINVKVFNDPKIDVSEFKIKEAISKFTINKNDLNIILGIGGSGPTKRIPAKIFLAFMEKITQVKKCRFFLATGKNNEEQKILNDVINSKYKNLCTPLDFLTIKETLPIIKNCDVAVCNDTSYSHLSAALGIKTITLMADTPLIYGSYSSKMFPIIPDGVENVTHDTFGKNKINPEKIFKKLIEIIN